MVVHVTVGTVHPVILNLLVELWNHREDPLDILLDILPSTSFEIEELDKDCHLRPRIVI